MEALNPTYSIQNSKRRFMNLFGNLSPLCGTSLFTYFFYSITNFLSIKTSKSTSKVHIKGGFFLESSIRFSNLQISKKKYSKKLSWAWNLHFPPITLYCSEKKPPLAVKLLINTLCKKYQGLPDWKRCSNWFDGVQSQLLDFPLFQSNWSGTTLFLRPKTHG